jgi:hypothetical protein
VRLSLLLLLGCLVEDRRNADIQVDVSGADWSDTDLVRLCLTGAGVLEEALAAGRVGLAGVPVDTSGPLLIDILDPEDDGLRLGRAGPVDLSAAQPWQETPWVACEGDCPSCTTEGSRAPEDAESWLVAVRFL